MGNELAEGVDVICVVAHNVAVLVCVEVSDREVLHPVKHRAAHLAEVALRNVRHKLIVECICNN